MVRMEGPRPPELKIETRAGRGTGTPSWPSRSQKEAGAKNVGAGQPPLHKQRPVLPPDKIEGDLEGRGEAKMG